MYQGLHQEGCVSLLVHALAMSQRQYVVAQVVACAHICQIPGLPHYSVGMYVYMPATSKGCYVSA